MPQPGDQHQDTHATTNPFLEPKQHVNEFTALEIATLQSRLDKQLGPEYISTRPGNGGGKVHYLAAEKVINLANEVFGFNGWSSSIQNVQIDFVDESPQTGKITLGLSTIVRVTLRDGTFHEDIGYGHIENCKGKAAAFEKAKKEAVTDAMKRSLRNFGNVLGNCLYDKDYLQKITKIKIAPSKWDPDNLHRHPNFAPIKKESIEDVERQKDKDSAARQQEGRKTSSSTGSIEFEDDFGGNDLDDTDFTNPDEVRLDDPSSGIAVPTIAPPNTSRNEGTHQNPIPRLQPNQNLRPANAQSSTSVPQPRLQQQPQMQPRQSVTPGQVQPIRVPPSHAAPILRTAQNDLPPNAAQRSPQINTRPTEQPDVGNVNVQAVSGFRNHPLGDPDGFISGRGADLLNQAPDSRPQNATIAPFNPHADSMSLRRTSGVNPGKSAPVKKQSVSGAIGPANTASTLAHSANGSSASISSATTPTRTNFVNPGADPNRKIGMPQSGTSQSTPNRAAYKPPATLKRPPLSDMSNIQQSDGASDVKKPKIEGLEQRPGDGQHTSLDPIS